MRAVIEEGMVPVRPVPYATVSCDGSHTHSVPAVWDAAGTTARCQICPPGGWDARPCTRGISVFRQSCREIQFKVGVLVRAPAEQRSFEQSFVWFLS